MFNIIVIDTFYIIYWIIISHLMLTRINERMNEWANEWRNEQTNERTNELTDENTSAKAEWY